MLLRRLFSSRFLLIDLQARIHLHRSAIASSIFLSFIFLFSLVFPLCIYAYFVLLLYMFLLFTFVVVVVVNKIICGARLHELVILKHKQKQ